MQVPEVRSYIDDFFGAADSFEAFCGLLTRFLAFCAEMRIHLSPQKFVLLPEKMPLVGRLVGPSTVEIDQSRIKDLKEMRAPEDKAELRSFLGMANYFDQFIRIRLAHLAAPLWELMQKGADFTWAGEHNKAFHAIIDAIVGAEPLEQWQPGLPIVVNGDASSYGIGGAVYQRHPDDRMGPLLFWSKKLTDAERASIAQSSWKRWQSCVVSTMQGCSSCHRCRWLL